MFGTATRDDWKQKYRELLAELEIKERAATAQTDALRRIAKRLAIAAMGRDPKVDRHLDDIMEGLTNKVSEDALSASLEQLVTAVVAEEKNTAVTAALDLARFVASLPLPPSDQRRHIDALEADTVSARARALSDLARELTDLLGDPALDDDENLRRAFDQFLSRLDGAESLAKTAAAIRADWQGSGNLSAALDQLAGEIADTIVALDRDKTDLESFLEQVTQQLGQFETWTEDSQKEAQARRFDGDELEKDVDLHVGALHRELDASTDLNELKNRVQNRLDHIADRLTAFREKEADRAVVSAERHANVQRELNRLKTRTKKLAARCADQESRLMHDVLTGVHTRYAYELRLQEEFQRWQRHGLPLTYTIWDIDHFKKVNDRFGHRAGDRLLAAFGSLLASQTRTEDFAARIGGEEFVILFPATPVDGALLRCEKLREQLANANIRYRQHALDVTVSCGLTQFVDGDTPQDVYERADGAMYQAKAQGRNRCVKI